MPSGKINNREAHRKMEKRRAELLRRPHLQIGFFAQQQPEDDGQLERIKTDPDWGYSVLRTRKVGEQRPSTFALLCAGDMEGFSSLESTTAKIQFNDQELGEVLKKAVEDFPPAKDLDQVIQGLPLDPPKSVVVSLLQEV